MESFRLLMLDALAITRLQDEATAAWHGDAQEPPGVDAAAAGGGELVLLLLDLQRANFDLWHEEDQARDPRLADAGMATIKRRIDGLNQQRNDVVEQIDGHLLRATKQEPAAPLHSETPGLILDRLSILALKIFHTREQAERTNASENHRRRNAARLQLLLEQRGDLAACLDQLWEEVMQGRRRFKLYRQMKMYNDPELNPVLYGRNGD